MNEWAAGAAGHQRAFLNGYDMSASGISRRF
jgi:hypothetical protein